jgi:hypothetical protein
VQYDSQKPGPLNILPRGTYVKHLRKLVSRSSQGYVAQRMWLNEIELVDDLDTLSEAGFCLRNGKVPIVKTFP